MSEGIVYILINEEMPGLVKIGKTINLEQRIRDLDTTGVPLPFECFHAARVADMEFVEKQLHDAFDDARIRKRREFFRISQDRVHAALMLVQIEDVTPRDDIVEDADDQAALDKARTRRARFNFRMVDIPAGTTLSFVKDPEMTCRVADKQRVEFEGEEISLSKAADIILERLGYVSPSVSGPLYWVYENETLDERRRRMEQGDD